MTPKKTPEPSKENPSAPNTAQFTATDKLFSSLQAAYALRGHTLNRTTSENGTSSYWAERWGLVRYLPTLHDAALFLAQIGGRV